MKTLKEAQKQEIIPLAKQVTDTYQERYIYGKDAEGNEELWPYPGWVQAETLEPNTKNRVYTLYYERTEVTCRKNKRCYEELYLSFSGGEEMYYFHFPVSEENAVDTQKRKLKIKEVQKRFSSMNYNLHKSIMETISLEARKCLDSILNSNA